MLLFRAIYKAKIQPSFGGPGRALRPPNGGVLFAPVLTPQFFSFEIH